MNEPKPKASKEFLFEILSQEVRLSNAERLRDEAEEWHLKALEIELESARENRQNRSARRARLTTPRTSYTFVALRTRQARQDIHRIYEETNQLWEDEYLKLEHLYGDPTTEGYAELRKAVTATSITFKASEENPLGVIGEILKDAKTIIEQEMNKSVRSTDPSSLDEAESACLGD